MVLGSLLLLSSMTASATEKPKHLSAVRQQIQQLKQTLTQDSEQKNQLQQHLKQAEINIAESAKSLQETEQKLMQQQTNLQQLQKTQDLHQFQLGKQQKQLAKHLQAAYRLGKQEQLQILLNQQNPQQLNRMLHYYHYLIQQRAHVAQAIHNTMVQLKLNQHAIEARTQELQKLQIQQKSTYLALTQNKENRQSILKKMNDKIQTKQEKLARLLADEKGLENVVQKLGFAKEPVFSSAPSFEKLKHKLSYPTDGKIKIKFGTPIEDSQLKWNGILISAPEGQNVKANAPGRVVFANWMPNFGLLLIIDHGNGYMTLYGHNNSLYKKLGDSVNVGDQIATVGHSGGHPSPGLYFAVRYKGKSLDPSAWLTH